jgi:hypothetical protein
LVFFAMAACDATPKVYGPTFDGGADASDAALDAPEESAPVDAAGDVAIDAPSCASTVAILGGNATTLFGAAGPGGSALTAASLPGTVFDCGSGCADPIAIARFGTGLLAVLATSPAGTLESTAMTTSWADPAPVASAATRDGPSLASIGGTAHLVYQAADYKYYHAEYTGSSWDAATDPVGGSATQSFGARAPAAAAAASDLVVVQAGSDSYLYDQTWNGAWQAAEKQGGAAVQNSLPPTIVALDGGSSDLLAAYLRLTDYKVMTVARTAGTWGTPMLVDANAYSNDPVALGALPGGKAIVVFRGSDGKPYFSTWDGATTWTAPAAVVTSGNPTIASVPSIAPGVCGADALIAFAESGGGVAIAPFSGGTFGAPQPVAGTSGAKFVAIGTLP